MKKLFFACAILLGSVGMYACGDGSDTTGSETDANETVIDTDTTVSEVEVERTVIETDTVTETETIDTDTSDN